jgi:hypothetical protein
MVRRVDSEHRPVAAAKSMAIMRPTVVRTNRFPDV